VTRGVPSDGSDAVSEANQKLVDKFKGKLSAAEMSGFEY
jgi:hypothetical protein